MAACGCNDGALGASQDNLVAWVQVGGASPLNTPMYAMTNRDWPAARISSATLNRRGARTVTYRRSGRNPRELERCGVRESAPAANSMTIDFAECGCGGFMPDELVSCGIDLYQQHICCDIAGEFNTGWSKIEVFTNIDFESDAYNGNVSFDPNDNGDRFISHTAEFEDKFTIYPMDFSQVQLDPAIDPGSFIDGIAVTDAENCGTSGCGRRQGCTDQWYAATREGNLIYKASVSADIEALMISGAWANTSVADTAYHNGRVYVSFIDAGTPNTGFWVADVNPLTGIPGTFMQVIVSSTAGTGIQKWHIWDNKLYAVGGDSVNGNGIVWKINNDSTFETTTILGDNSTTLRDMDSCGKKAVAVGDTGTVLSSTGCAGSLVQVPVSPDPVNIVRTVGMRTGDEWWVGVDGGRIYYTADDGNSWEEKVFPFSGTGNILSLKWANSSVGWVVQTDLAGVPMVWTTWDGGESWVGAGDRFNTLFPSNGLANTMVIPCCSRSTEQVNNIFMAGSVDGTDGALFRGEIATC